jgi:hypothetical protein
MIHPNPSELGFLPDRLARIGAHVQGKYLDTGKLPFGALLIGRGDEVYGHRALRRMQSSVSCQ